MPVNDGCGIYNTIRRLRTVIAKKDDNIDGDALYISDT